MAHSTLTPVFVGLRAGLHVLFAALLALVVVRVLVVQGPAWWLALLLAGVFGVLYLLGAVVASVAPPRRMLAGSVWLALLSLAWIALLVLVPEAAYLVFPLFFLYLHVLPRIIGPLAVVLATGVAIVALGLHGGFSVGGVIGPLVGAGVALLIGLGYRAIAREAVEREALVAELIATRDRLVATEREQGVLAERARLAREIHDTVAQGLSSIQLLLHAAERADGERPGIEHVRLARETAAEGVAEVRRFIRELAPPPLEHGLAAALQRLAATQWSPEDLRIEVEAPEGIELPMPTQTALLRIAQGALANAVQHAGASVVRIALLAEPERVRLRVVDDGVGFDSVAVREASTDSFGLRAMRERAEQLGGRLEVDSGVGRGAVLTVTLPREPA